MGKTPKKAAPGGDERNLYVRRFKATTAPSKASESSLHERQRESESSNRPKLSGIHKRIQSTKEKNFKTKVRTETKTGPKSTSKRASKPASTSKQQKISAYSIEKPEGKATGMQPESEDAEVKLNTSVEKEVLEESPSIKNNDDIVKECVEYVVSEHVVVSEELVFPEEQIELQENENDSQQNVFNQSRESEEFEENDIKLSYETEETLAKALDDKPDDKDLKDETNDMLHSTQPEVKNGIQEKEDKQNESQTDTESCSVDIVESTTSELSEVSEVVPQTEIPKGKEKSDDTTESDPLFVSYDPTIMLKDVQIKLNDCLKDNSKLYDVSNAEPSTFCHPSKDLSFGKTLRNISGRHSIGRMRHVTLREQRHSPNSSLFVNTSNLSSAQDELGDYKILRYTTGLPDTVPTNGSPMDRKRKLENEGWNSEKKQKTESESSFLNTSINLLKGLRRPVQVSTPIVADKFQSGKLNISGMNDNESNPNESGEGPRKWCVIM